MEDGFRETENGVSYRVECLNPCPCGRWLQRLSSLAKNILKAVLILVLVEDGFREMLKTEG